MGKKIPLVSFLCGVLSRKKPPPPDQDDGAAARPDDNLRFSTSGGGGDGDATTIPKDAAAAQSPFAGDQLRDAADQLPAATSTDQLHQPLPPPPGIHHQRSNSTASCHRHSHQRSNSAASKLVSSMSMRVLGAGGCGGGGGGGGGGAGRQEKTRNRDKKFSHEDSIWKKTIILGEKCRVPDDDEDSILYDEKGKRIATYHPKTHSGTLSYSRQTSCIDQDESSKK